MKCDPDVDLVLLGVVAESVMKGIIEIDSLRATRTVGVRWQRVPSRGVFSVSGGCGIFISFSGLSCLEGYLKLTHYRREMRF